MLRITVGYPVCTSITALIWRDFEYYNTTLKNFVVRLRYLCNSSMLHAGGLNFGSSTASMTELGTENEVSRNVLTGRAFC